MNALQEGTHPVAFPTETVYGLGANALSSLAVRGIYTAKQRPSDNPLIVHVASLEQLRSLLSPNLPSSTAAPDPIPAIYHPLISRFWPGPLTILLPLPIQPPVFAPEISHNLPTFAVRMPSSTLALALIRLAGLPLAAPSANASTRPSPTSAQHVLHDLDGRIELILDGGECDVGVESTVVDGLRDPPCVLRPGGVGLEEIRKVKGWERVTVGYGDSMQRGGSESQERSENVVEKVEEGPRAPGMKYKHYAPRARVVLVEAETGRAERNSNGDDSLVINAQTALQRLIDAAVTSGERSIGILRTRRWQVPRGKKVNPENESATTANATSLSPKLLQIATSTQDAPAIQLWDLVIGPTTQDVARGLFAALRELDLKGVESILVEGIPDGEQEEGQGSENDELAAAVMNRLRKAVAGG